MDPRELIQKWSSHITSETTQPNPYITPQPGIGPEPECPEPDLFTPQPGPVAGQTASAAGQTASAAKASNLPPKLQAALDSVEEMKPVLQQATGFSWLDYVSAAWEHWEKTGDPDPFLKVEAKLRGFARMLWRAERMLPTLKLNNHPKVTALEAGLAEGALVNPEVRMKWKEMADLVWREFIHKTGPFASQIIQETS